MAEPWAAADNIVWQPPAERRAGKLGFVNRAIAGMIGAPVDVVNWALGGVGLGTEKPVGGSRFIAEAMRAGRIDVARPEEVAETYGERVAEGVGAAVSALLPGAGLVGQASRAAGPVARGVAQTIKRPFVATPGRAIALEATAGAGAGAGGLAGEREAVKAGIRPEYGRMVGELAGGFGAAAGPGVAARTAGAVARRTPVVGLGLRAVRATLTPFTAAGARVRASRRIQELSGDPEAAIAAIEEPTISGLTPAQRTGQPGLLALEREVLDTDMNLAAQHKARSEEGTRLLEEAIREPAEGATAGDARQYIAAQREYLTSLIEQRLMQAGERVNQALADVTPAMKESEASAIVRRELTAALKAARAQERELWAAVPEDVRVSTSNAKEAFEALQSDVSRAQRKHIPEVAIELLDSDRNSAFGADETVKEMHGLYSELREIERTARSSGARNAARIAENLADAVLRDLETADAVSEPLELARSFSRDLNDRFTRGEVGQVLGMRREGDPKLPEELTLARTAGRGGLPGAIAVDDIRAAVQGSADAEAAIRDYVQRRFVDYAAPRGELNPQRAADFIRQNAELLDRLPDVRDRIESAASEGALSAEMQQMARAGLREAEQAPTAAFVRAPYGKEFGSVLQAQDPATAAKALAARARGDETGKALAGLKAAAVDHVIGGKGVRAALADPRTRSALKEIFTPNEMARMGRVATEMEKQAAAARLPAIGGIVDDPVNTILSYATRVVAARAGARVGAGTSGASLLTAGWASQRVQRLLEGLNNNSARALLSRAVQDEDLFKSLLRGADIPPGSKAESRVVEALTGIIGQQAAEDDVAPSPEHEGNPWESRDNIIWSPGQRSQRTEAAPVIRTSGGHVNVEDVTPELRDQFGALQRRFGHDLTVTSGYRDPEYNRKVGGAKRSRHMHGDALDISTAGMSLREKQRLVSMASEVGFTGIGIYEGSIHLDMGGRRAWGPSRKAASVPGWARPMINRHLRREA